MKVKKPQPIAKLSVGQRLKLRRLLSKEPGMKPFESRDPMPSGFKAPVDVDPQTGKKLSRKRRRAGGRNAIRSRAEQMIAGRSPYVDSLAISEKSY